MSEGFEMNAGRPVVELRPGVLRPDWSVVTAQAAEDALSARDASRVNLIEHWAVALDAAEDRVWRAVIRLFVELGRAPRIDEIAVESGLEGDAVSRILGRLQERDLLGLSGDQIINAYPFTTRATGHVVDFGTHKLNSLCAIDALGTGAMCRRNVLIESRCRACGKAVRISTVERGTQLGRVFPAGTVVWHDIAYRGSAAASCCPNIEFFCSDEHLNEWLRMTGPRNGQRLSPDEALQVGSAIFGPVLTEPARIAQA